MPQMSAPPSLSSGADLHPIDLEPADPGFLARAKRAIQRQIDRRNRKQPIARLVAAANAAIDRLTLDADDADFMGEVGKMRQIESIRDELAAAVANLRK